MRYFKDFEFSENGTTIIPISMGIVCETGAELYLEFVFDEDEVREANPWVAQNVLPRLGPAKARVDFDEAKIQIYNFISVDPRPVFWGYFFDYDWVAFCRLWGKMVDLPTHFPKWGRDIKQLFWHLGSPEGVMPPQDKDAHHALVDARWNKRAFEALKPLAEAKGIVI